VAALGPTAQALTLQAFVDNNQVAADKTKVRFYQLSPDLPGIDVAWGEATKMSGMTYPKSSDYLSLAAGTYNVGVSNGPSGLPTLPVDLKANTVTSVFAVGLVSGDPKFRLVSASAAGLPNLPQTGSDPTPQGIPAQIWLFASAACLMLLALAGQLARSRGVRRSQG
jgi:hypothetical protein